MTLRELVWMATERRRFMGELSAWHLAGIIAYMPFTAARLNPTEINPYGTKPTNPMIERLAKLRANLAWEAMFKRDQ